MKLLHDKRFFRFLIPSLIGAFLFVTPINQDGNLTIPIAVVANALLDIISPFVLTLTWLLISLSAILTVIHKTVGIGLLKKDEKSQQMALTFAICGLLSMVIQWHQDGYQETPTYMAQLATMMLSHPLVPMDTV